MNDNPTLANLMPAKARAWVYASLSAANGGYLVAEAAYEIPTWILIVLGVINAAGLQLARSNTAPTPPHEVVDGPPPAI